MSTVSDIRDAIKDIMDGIEHIGQVHSYERYAKRSADFKVFYKDPDWDQIRGWHIRRTATAVTADTMDSDEEEYTFEIKGYMSLSDDNESERVFDELIESIRHTFIQHNTLNNTVETCRTPSQAGIQVVATGHVMLVGVLCHEAVLSLNCLVDTEL